MSGDNSETSTLLNKVLRIRRLYSINEDGNGSGEGKAPATSIASGDLAGLTGDPPVSKKKQKEIVKKKKKNSRRGFE